MESTLSLIGHAKRFWRLHGLFLGALSMSVFALGCAVQEPAFYEGTWVVTKAYQPGVSAHSKKEAEHFLGSSIIYTPQSAKLDQHVCESPIYKSEKLKVDDFQFNYQVSVQELGFSNDSVTQVSLTCEDGESSLGSLMLFQENTNAYTLVDGTFFKLEKTL